MSMRRESAPLSGRRKRTQKYCWNDRLLVRPSSALPKLTAANLAIVMEQPSAHSSTYSVEHFVEQQSQVSYPPRSPSLSPMVASQDRILAEQAQQAFVASSIEQRRGPEYLPPLAMQTNAPLLKGSGVATSMRSKAGKTTSARAQPPLSKGTAREQQDHVDRLKTRKEARRQKRLIVQDRSRSLSSRVRERKRPSESLIGIKDQSAAVSQSSRSQRSRRMLGMTIGKGFKPMARMTSERMTMVSHSCAGAI